MKSRLIAAFVIVCIVISSVQAGDLRHLLPRPKSSFDKLGSFTITSATPIVIADKADSVTIRAALYLQTRLQIQNSLSLGIQKASQYNNGAAILVGVHHTFTALQSALDARMPSGVAMPPAEGYVLDVDGAKIILAGSDSNGVCNGVTTLLQLVNSGGSFATVLGCHIWDYPDYPVRWVFSTHNLLVNNNITFLKSLADTMALYKLNGLQQNDFKYSILQIMGSNYFQNVDTLKKSLKARNIAVIPGVIGLGWSEGILFNDPNLAEGLHAVTTYVIDADTAKLIPDTRVTIVNGGFEQYNTSGVFSGWGFYDGANQSTFVDNAVVHSGAASVRCTNFTAGNPSGNCRFQVKVNCDSNGYYVMSVWFKTQNFSGGDFQFLAIGGDDGRVLTSTSLTTQQTADWTRAEVTFNTLNNKSVLLYCGVWGGGNGTIWLDDFTVKSGGLCNVLRRGGTPVSVRNKVTGLLYNEGVDFQTISDPKLNASAGNYFPYHTPPTFRRIVNANLHNGDTIRISYYHPYAAVSDNTGNGSVMACVSEDTLYSILTDQVKRVDAIYKPATFFMGHDEIRNMNHDLACTSRNLSPVALLADNITRCHDLIRTLSPNADILIWSDMIDSLHNAHNNYYLINGDLTGDWLSIPKDITVVNWNGGLAKPSLQFFAKYGFKQISSPYYDVGNTSSIRSWRIAQEGVNGVRGMMYTTWSVDYRFLGAFSYYSWGAGPNVIHTPLDTNVLSLSTIAFDAEVYPDPFDATDAITSVFANITDTSGQSVAQVPLFVTTGAKYHGTVNNTFKTSGFYYTITSTNKQGLIRTSPKYSISPKTIVSPRIPWLEAIPDTLNFGDVEIGKKKGLPFIFFAHDGKIPVKGSSVVPVTGSLFDLVLMPQVGYVFNQSRNDDSAIYTPNHLGRDTTWLTIQYDTSRTLVVVFTGTGISPAFVKTENNSDVGITINPNPFTDQTTVDIPTASPSVKITLTDILGKMISLPISEHLVLSAKQLGLYEGMYVLRVEDRGNIVQKNIIHLK